MLLEVKINEKYIPTLMDLVKNLKGSCKIINDKSKLSENGYTEEFEKSILKASRDLVMDKKTNKPKIYTSIDEFSKELEA